MNKKELAKMRRESAQERKRIKRQIKAGVSNVSRSFAALQKQAVLGHIVASLDKRVIIDSGVSCPLWMLL